MFGEVKPENLGAYLAKIDAFFPDFEAGAVINQNDINSYYKESFWGYKIFHSWAGAIHMAISPDGTVSKNDYFAQAIYLESEIKRLQLKNGAALEIGCGAGFNIRFLAGRLPNFVFSGIDISTTNVISAQKLCGRFSNCEIWHEDFHDLSRFDDNQFDVVFAVETVCHALDLNKVLGEARRVLKPGGQLIIFDGYRAGFDELAPDWKKAIIYTERAMAVPRFLTAGEFENAAVSSGLVLISNSDLSAQIMPNLVRLSDRAKAFFRLTPVAKMMKATLPTGLVTNAIAGLLMSVTVKTGAHEYRRIQMSKP